MLRVNDALTQISREYGKVGMEVATIDRSIPGLPESMECCTWKLAVHGIETRSLGTIATEDPPQNLLGSILNIRCL